MYTAMGTNTDCVETLREKLSKSGREFEAMALVRYFQNWRSVYSVPLKLGDLSSQEFLTPATISSESRCSVRMPSSPALRK